MGRKKDVDGRTGGGGKKLQSRNYEGGAAWLRPGQGAACPGAGKDGTGRASQRAGACPVLGVRGGKAWHVSGALEGPGQAE